LEGLLGLLGLRPLGLELADLLLELLILLAHRAVVDGAGQKAPDRLDDAVHP
jgi:hypothetical protein